jgi:signal transduction histidine kinase
LQNAFLERYPTELHALSSEQKDLLVKLIPFYFGTGEGGIIVQLTDVTGIHEAERRWREILSFLTHDLKSPISSILAATELITLQKEIPAESKYLTKIKDSAEHTLSLADDFLSLLMAEGSRMAHFYQLDLVDTLEFAISLVNTQAENKHVTIHFGTIEDAKILGAQNRR